MELHERRVDVLVLLIGTLVSMTTVQGAVELKISVIWDSREIEDTSAVMTSLSQISPNYEMHEMTFRAEYIDLSTMDVMGVKDAVCQHSYTGTVAFLYVYACSPQLVVEAAIRDLNATAHLRMLRTECDPDAPQISSPMAEFFGNQVSDVGRVVMEVVAHSGWEDTVILFDDSRRDDVESLMFYSEISNSSMEEINYADFAPISFNDMESDGGSVTSGDVNATSGGGIPTSGEDDMTSGAAMAFLDFLEQKLYPPRTTILVLKLEDTLELLRKMNIYNSVRNVQGVFIYLDQWLVVAEHDWLDDLQEAIDDVDNVAAVTPGWNRNQTTLQLINDAYANALEVVQTAFCSSDNVTAGGALPGECSSPYGMTFTQTVDDNLQEAEAELLCDTCGDYILHTTWWRDNSTRRDVAIVATWTSHGFITSGNEAVEVFPNLKFAFNGRHFIVGTNALNVNLGSWH